MSPFLYVKFYPFFFCVCRGAGGGGGGGGRELETYFKMPAEMLIQTV